MTVAELKAFLPADSAVVYLEGYELLAEDVTIDADGDLQLSCSDDAIEAMGGDDDEEEADDEVEDEAE